SGHFTSGAVACMRLASSHVQLSAIDTQLEKSMNRTVRLMTAFFMLAGLVGLGIQSATAADAGQDSSDSDRAMSDTWITTKVRAEEDDESRTVGEAVDDTWITTKVKAELASTEDLASSGISVTTEDGTVTLSGTVDNNVAKKKAVAAAESVKGVKKVKSSDL